MASSPASRQLLYSLLTYAASDAFQPKTAVTPEWLKNNLGATMGKTVFAIPAEFSAAKVYIECANKLASGGDAAWEPAIDSATLVNNASYSVNGAAWRNQADTYWVGNKLGFTLRTTVSDISRLLVRFRDPNHNNRSGKGTFEGRPFEIPAHADKKDGALWVELRVEREDGLDGVLKFETETLTGPNLMIDRVVLIPK